MTTRAKIEDLAEAVAKRTKVTPEEALNFVTEMFNLIAEALGKDKLVKVRGIGTFKLLMVDDRESVDVNTGRRIVISGHNKISFTPDPVLRDEVNKPFADFASVEVNDGVPVEALISVPAEELQAEELPDEQTDEEQMQDEEPMQPERLTDVLADEEQPQETQPKEAQPEVDEAQPQPLTEQPRPLTEQPRPLTEQPREAAPQTVAQPVRPAALASAPVPEETLSAEVTTAVQEAAPAAEEAAPAVQQEASETPTDQGDTAADDAAVRQPQGDDASVPYTPLPEPTHRRRRCSVCWLILCSIVALAVGYWLGSEYPIGYVMQQLTRRHRNVVVVNPSEEPQQAQDAAASAQPRQNEPAAQEASSAKQTEGMQSDKTDFAEEPVKAALEKEAAQASKPTQTTQPAKAAKPVSEAEAKQKWPQVEGGDFLIVGEIGKDTMKVGRTLLKISKRHYGSDKYVQYICTMNGIANPDVVPLNMELRLPKLQKK